MCLDYSLKITEKIKERLNKSSQKSIICYKIFRLIDRGLYSFFEQTYWGKFPQDMPIKLISDRERKTLTTCEKTSKFIQQGIHVFINRRAAKRYCLKTYSSSYDPSLFPILPVICKKSDFVTAGTFEYSQSAVFMKVKIDSSRKVK